MRVGRLNQGQNALVKDHAQLVQPQCPCVRVEYFSGQQIAVHSYRHLIDIITWNSVSGLASHSGWTSVSPTLATMSVQRQE